MLAAQTSAAPVPSAADIAKLFGPSFQPLPKLPVLTADLERNGTEDAVVAATGDNPLVDQTAFHYKVIDPYSSYFGLGDTRITVHFLSNTGKPQVLLVVQDWKAPKAKWVVINLPYEKLSVGRMPEKKKALAAIFAEDIGGLTSWIYWDGKKWKWSEAEDKEQ